MNFAHAGNAMGCWIAAVFASTNTPWDRFLAGNTDAMTETQLLGAKAFLGSAKCSQCHAGPALSDNKFHNVLIAQVGPGFGNGPDGHDDWGRMRQTDNVKHKYQFRTPPLRNVELTAPVRPRRRDRRPQDLGGSLQRRPGPSSRPTTPASSSRCCRTRCCRRQTRSC